MSKKSASTVFGMPFKKEPRRGQMEVFEEIINNKNSRSLNVQLPTGYGKSFVSAGVYSILKKQNRVNRLLIIVPRDAQSEQYEKDGHLDLADAIVGGPLAINDVRFGGVQSVKHHRNGTRQAFVLTIQALQRGGTGDILRELLSSGKWMITVDEYHHYGDDRAWGKIVKSLPYNFLLAMSATPYRPEDDSVFGNPDIIVSYREAVKQKCLKPLVGHSYIYQIDAYLNGDIISYTTDELIEEAGGSSPEIIEKHRIERNMRWSPKYVSPLVTHPIERMCSERLRTGYKLQAIIGAMSVSHAEMVCEQIRTMYPELSVDWVGTGNNGRSPDINRRILKKFCPPKNEITGTRIPELDILVHVGIAGEGLDSGNVSEVIHLNKASINNSNNQENGRAARYLPGVKGHINFDSCSEYAEKGYVGDAIMDAMDCLPASHEPEEPNSDPIDNDYQEMPDNPGILIYDMYLKDIDSGAPEVMMMAESLVAVSGCFKEQLGDPESELHKKAVIHLNAMREKDAEEFNEKSIVCQWKEQVGLAITKLTGLVVSMMKGKAIRVNSALAGDVKRRINTRKKRTIGEVRNDIQTLKTHWQWAKNLEKEILETKEVPSWLQ